MSEVPQATPLDLDRFSEALRRWLYDRVVQIQFSPSDSTSTATPDDAGLQVISLVGRWFAIWRDPDQPPMSPARLRIQIARIEPSHEHPWDIELHAV